MSYTPEPDPRQEMPKFTAFANRIKLFYKTKPIRFWGYLWLITLVTVIPTLATDGMAGFDRPKGKGILTFAVLGWIYPFYLLVKRRRT
ncbi:MAG: hypothetical protein ACJAR9_001151 [Celeribacter sp.]|jgi:hypothetical protein